VVDKAGWSHPLGRTVEVQDVVDAVMFLESASFVTGEILHVERRRRIHAPTRRREE
jgi:NAD(P)-dependent dehydrogenase (short-subunit alcohol dehydrogenase family)